MTKVLEAALAEVAKLPPDEQDALASLLLDEIRSEQRWAELFRKSPEALKNLAAEAVAEFKAGQTKPLDETL